MKRKLLLLLLLAGAGRLDAQEKELKIGDDAPPLYIQRWIKGTPVAKFEKGKVYVVDISEIFCPGCLTIIPELTQISQRYRGKAEVFVVYSLATPQQAKNFADRMGKKLDYGVSVDNKQNSTTKAWGVSIFPSCFIVNQQGKIAYMGMEVEVPLESVIKTGQYNPDTTVEKQKWAEWEEAHKIWKQYEEQKNVLCQKEDYKGLVHLIDSLFPLAPDKIKYDEGGRHGLLRDKFEANLLNNDSVAADNCLKEMMALTTEGWWVHLHSIFQYLVPQFRGSRLLPFNYQRYLEIAERAANDGGGADKVAQLCMQGRIRYAYNKNLQEALALLNEAAIVAKKNGVAEEIQNVERTISQIKQADKKQQEANAAWEILMNLMKDGGFPFKPQLDKARQENGWVGYILCIEKNMRSIVTRAADFYDRYPIDERRRNAMDIFFRAHMYTMFPWIDTNRVTAELTVKINARHGKMNEYFQQGAQQGKKIATGPPLFRMFPLDVKAEADWRRKRNEMCNEEMSGYKITLAEKERIEWMLFTSDWGQAATEWSKVPDMDEKPESETALLENDYWEFFAIQFWEAMWLRYNGHIAKYADLPVIADRALDFLGATAGRRHSEKAAKKFWERIGAIYGDSTHPLMKKPGIQALLKQAQLQVDADKVAAGSKAIELQFTAFDGREVEVAKLKGKVIIIDFWATWCAPCLASMPHLKEMYDKYHDEGLEIIGISLDPGLWEGKIEEGNRQQIEDVIKKYTLAWPQRFTGQGMDDPFAKLYSISSLPTVWLLDKEGRIVEKNARGERLEPLIRKYLGLDQ